MNTQENIIKGNVIIAPHPDDEVIGCYEILCDSEKDAVIIYTGELDYKRKEEALKLKEYFENIKMQLFLRNIPQPFLQDTATFYFPDPSTEIHPAHREYGIKGEALARAGFNVIFYSTLMNTPYIHEVKNPSKKEDILNSVYPSQKSLWEYEKKFVLFEGRCKWMF